MSRSNNTEQQAIATRYLEWSGSEGKMKYYDKSTKENVLVDLPFTFTVLDILHTITGYSDTDESGFWSNEVKNIQTDELTVQTKKNKYPPMVYGKMADILNRGAKYAQSVYIAFKDESDTLVIGNLKLYGSAIGSWIEFRKKSDVYKVGCKIVSAEPKKKGKTDYFEPVYKEVQISDGTNTEAIELDKRLQEYLSIYFGRKAQDKAIIEETAQVADKEMASETPFTDTLMQDEPPF